MISPRARSTLTLGFALVTGGCFLTPRPHLPAANAGTRISGEEVERSGATTMWEALRLNVRYAMFEEDGYGTPTRVRRRGASTIALFEDTMILVDNVRVPDFVILQQMPAHDIDWIQVLSGVEATTYYGTNAGDGAILIFTRGG